MGADFTLGDLVRAAAAGLGPAMAQRLQAVYPHLIGGDALDETPLSYSEASRLIVCVLQTDMVVPNMSGGPALRMLELRTDSRTVCLSPKDARLHPLAGAWVGEKVSDGIERLLRSAGDLSMMAGSAPSQWFWTIGGDGDAVTATLFLTFADAPAVSVVAHYGEILPPLGLETTRRLHGGNIAVIGDLLWEATDMARLTALAADAAELAGAAAPSQTLH